MRITVLGLGGVGGYVGALLADQYKNEEVTFVMRGERAACTREQGLLLKSDYRGTHLVHPAQVVESAEGRPVQDYVIVCVKNYSLEEVCRTLSGCVDDHTIVIPIMNGADPGDRVRQYLGKGLVLDSLIYIVAFRTPEEIVQQGNFAKVFIGKKNPSEVEQEKIAKAAELMAAAGVDCFVADDIEAAIWRKYILNCAYNVSTAYYNSPIGPIRADKARAEEYEKLVYEAYAVALAKKIHVEQKDIDHIIWRFYYDHAENASSSLQRDMGAGRVSELDTFCGYIVQEGHRLGVPVPVMERMYGEMKEREVKAGLR